METPCPSWSDFQPNTPMTVSGGLDDPTLRARGFYDFGSGCQMDANPTTWTVYARCTNEASPPWVYVGEGICRCPVGQVESDGTCVSSCPSGEDEQRICLDKPSSKNNGPTCVPGNPCDPATGIKTQREPIYRGHGVGTVQVELTYNSRLVDDPLPGWSGAFGKNWIAGFEQRLKVTADATVTARRADGKDWEFKAPPSGLRYLRDSDINDDLDRLVDGSGATTGWKITAADGDRIELYYPTGGLYSITGREGLTQVVTYSDGATSPLVAPKAGLPIRLTDGLGRQLEFIYDALARIVQITDYDGRQILIQYDGVSGGCPAPGSSEPGCYANNPTQVTFQDGATRIYHYNEAASINGGTSCGSLPNGLLNHLTGITDENGTRLSNYTYDCQGRALATEHAGGVNRYAFTYNTDGTTTVLDPRSTSRQFSFQNVQGVVHNAGISQACPHCGANSSNAAYDANGNPTHRIDFNGNRTNYTSYDAARNLELARTEGLTAAGAATAVTRTIETQWHATYRLPTLITEKNSAGAVLRTTSMSHDAAGNVLTRTVTAGPKSRTWTYTYNANGSVLTANGPRTDVSDVTTYSYYANDNPDPGKRGNLEAITNAAGHVTSITEYNAHGQPLTIVDPNGLVTSLGYDFRQRLTSRVVGSEITSYDYDGVGQLTKVTQPDGSFLSYTYDAAHRLTQITDNLGNRIAYTLDAMGNRTQEQVFDPSNALAQTRTRVYDSLNRLFQEIGAQSQTTEYGYDSQGNVTSVNGPLAGTVDVTTNAYDALNRLLQVTDPGSGITQYEYNALDQLTKVTDPRNLATSYTYNGLGDLDQQVSPDTGTTANTYDPAGNLLTQTDAKGQTTSYAYDVLNRVTLITFHDGSTQVYAYDQGAYGLGRLASITERDPANQVTSLIAYTYDQKGRLITETRTIGGVAYVTAYSYDSAGRLSGMVYPSGRQVAYTLDALGRIRQIDTIMGGTIETVVYDVAYRPFGPAQGFTFGNNQAYARSFDQDGRVASYTAGSQTFALGFDLASRINSLAENGNPPNSNTYTYDALDRLASAVLPSTNYGYSYDATGNRLTKLTGASTDNYAYAGTSNRIASITPASGPVRNFVFDANGSTTSDGVNSFAYDVRGRMVQATSTLGATNYQVNALGQRIRKTNSLGDVVFHYDTQGRLIAESTPAGQVQKEYIHLGDIPVAVIK